MLKKGKYTICTISEFSRILAKSVWDALCLDSDWHNYDFGLVEDLLDEEPDADPEYVASGICGWYGVKYVNTGFDIVLVSDYYGGGCAEMCLFWDDGFGDAQIPHMAASIQDMILKTLGCQEYGFTPESLILAKQLEDGGEK